MRMGRKAAGSVPTAAGIDAEAAHVNCRMLVEYEDGIGAFNVTTGRKIEIRTLAEQVIRLSRSGSEIRFVPRRSWDRATRRRGEIAKACEHLGYEPKTTLGSDLSSTIGWIRSLSPELIGQ